jgi:hypothetical protein
MRNGNKMEKAGDGRKIRAQAPINEVPIELQSDLAC